MAKRSGKTARGGRQVSRPRRYLFVDESGFTGPDLLERSQPFVAYAAVEVEERRATEIVAESRGRYGTQAAEIKASNLLRRSRGRRQALEILQAVSVDKMRILVHNKRLALAAKFVEYVLEPGLTGIWAALVHRGLHRFVAMLLYRALEAENVDAEELVRRFSDFMRGRNDDALWELLDDRTPQHPFLEDLATIARHYRHEIMQDRANAHAALDVAPFVMDLTSTSILSLLASMPHRRDFQYRIVLDDSRAMRSAAPMLNVLAPGGVAGVVRSGEVEFATSGASAAIQIADLAAGAALYVFNKREESEMFEPVIVPNRLGDYNLQTDFIEIAHPDENAEVLRMIARYIRQGRDPVEAIREGILQAPQ